MLHEWIEKGIQNEVGTLQGRDQLVGVCLFEKMLLKLYLNDIESEDVDRIQVAQDKDTVVDSSCFSCCGGVELSPLFLRSLLAYWTSPGWWMMDDDDVEQSVECSAGETEVLGENLPLQ
jgi:hypothetical protein